VHDYENKKNKNCQYPQKIDKSEIKITCSIAEAVIH